jgi:hypothetical protein
MEYAIALEAPADVLEQLKKQTSLPDLQWSEPIVIDSVADALDSPIGGEDIRQALQMAIIVFKTGAAAAAFAQAVYELARARKAARIIVKNPSSGTSKGVITSSSSDTQVRDLISR